MPVKISSVPSTIPSAVNEFSCIKAIAEFQYQLNFVNYLLPNKFSPQSKSVVHYYISYLFQSYHFRFYVYTSKIQ